MKPMYIIPTHNLIHYERSTAVTDTIILTHTQL